MPIRIKLLLAFGVIGLMAFAVGLVAVKINTTVAHDVAQVSHSSLVEGRAADGMSKALYDLELALLLSSGPGEPEARRVAVETAIREFDAGMELFHEATETAIQLARDEGDTSEIAEAEGDVPLYQEIAGKFMGLRDVAQEVMNGQPLSAVRLAEATSLYEEIHALVQDYQDTTSDDLDHEVNAIAQAIHEANLIIIGSMLAILVLGGLLAWFIAQSVSRPLALLTQAAGEIARGRLDTRVALESNDEIGLLAKTFNQMTLDLGATTVSRDYLDSILKSMANSLIVIDLAQTIRSANAATLAMLGYMETGLVGQPITLVLPDAARNPQLIGGEQKNGDEVRRDMETTYRTRSGEAVPVTFSAANLRDHAGRTVGMVCVAQDISERKKAERELERTGKKLMEASRQAGMAEVAASVLHNVGNTLNSVNVSGSVIADSLRTSRSANLAGAVKLMQAHAEDLAAFLSSDPQGRVLPGYLADLAVHLQEEKEMVLQEVESLINNITHIKEIISMQQNYARTSGLAEECLASELMEAAIQINGSALGQHQISVVREYVEVPPVHTEKHRVLQILVNLVSNAQKACEDMEKEKRIVLRIWSANGRMTFQVADNGMGIPPENLNRIFSYGFTTRKGGHGFGLHNSALTARELGGKLSVVSEGPGKGATFTLELPSTTT